MMILTLLAQTTTPPPALMLSYLPALLHASQILLKGLSEDPSAWGVSTAFMGCEDELETAMVAWSTVAGQFFSGKGKSKSWRRARSRSNSQSNVSVPNSPSSLHIPPMPSLKPGGDGVGTKLKKNSKGEVDEKCEKTDEEEGKKATKRAERKLSVRDLAIQPTQRVMRYVMLYRGTFLYLTRQRRALTDFCLT
jgi:hypothetical protein